MKRLITSLTILSLTLASAAQPAQFIRHREASSITFAVDEVDLPENLLGFRTSGEKLAPTLSPQLSSDPSDWYSDWEPEILFNSFASEELFEIGEDVVFQMLLKAWCQHRPVSLSPDVIWLLICQQFSHYVNEHPEKMRKYLVNHQGKMELAVKSGDLLSGQADWAGLIDGFVAEIGKFSRDGLAQTLVADFSTTGTDERIASGVTLMDVVKPYYEYIAFYAVCGIPSITLTGTPDDWRSVLEKTRALRDFGMAWWVDELEPILTEFVKAAEGDPDYWFWKDIVKKSRPYTIQGPTCGRRRRPLTRFDGWFLKLFPFDNDGRTPNTVTITQTMLSETVAVPFTYRVVNLAGDILSETPLELIAGIVGVEQDEESFLLTPKIGWFVRTANP